MTSSASATWSLASASLVSDAERSELLARLAELLREAGYTAEPALSASVVAAVRQGYTLAAELELMKLRAENLPLELLTRLFVVGNPARVDDLDAAFPGFGAAGFLKLRLLHSEDETATDWILSGEYTDVRLFPALSLTPVEFRGETLWAVSDLDDHLRKEPVTSDFVMGVGGATRSLLQLLPEKLTGTALEIGTGSGIVAVALARLGAQVTATDISERALQLAQMTAALNGVTGIDFRLGSMFAPVAGEKFDFIASNPPFVIPNQAHDPSYRSAGHNGGESLILEFASDFPAHLKPDGSAVFLGNWETTALQDTLADNAHLACAQITVRDFLDPVLYATTWARDGGLLPGGDEADRAIGGWLESFQERRSAGVAMGWVQAQAKHADDEADAAPLVELTHNTDAITAKPGSLHAVFQQAAALHALSDAELLNHHFVKNPAVQEIRTHAPGSADPSAIALQSASPFVKSVSVDTATAAVYGACDGELSMGELCTAVASIFEVDADALTAQVAVSFLRLSWLGYFA